LLELFAEGAQAGCSEVVMEMSSHALEQERVWGIPVDVAIYTNLTQDHLDYHGTMDAYARSKARLFAGLGTPPPRIAVVNVQDEWSTEMVKAFRGERLMTYGAGESYAAYRAVNVRLGPGHTGFVLHTPEGSVAMESSLTGRVNVMNLLATSCAALARGLTLDQIARSAAELKQVPGRFEVVTGSKELGFTVVVDYAHTPDALANLIELARGLVGEQGGRVITMFGCGGDRDKGKRPKMGRVAGADSDVVIVTSDNPRSEEPMEIINEALAGVRETNTTFVVEEDRRAAIEVAIRSARPGDIVLLAGKGHEKVQIFADSSVEFDDVQEAARVMKRLQEEKAR
jgi:UDP-N-acetylmuramoyl-L-alanyl-D-glutamate--2,6-diaminopimelate ligase